VSPEQWIVTVLANADGLRAKGILSLKCGDNEATFAGLPAPVDPTPRPQPKDLLNDREWGLPPGLRDDVLGKPEEHEDDEEPLWGGSEGAQ
jgi:hypothetical protein